MLMETKTSRMFAVINPVAGSCDAATVQDTLDRFCASAGIKCDCYLAKGSGEESTAVGRAVDQGYDRVVACGGDGTVAAVAGGLVGRSIPLAVLPVGTANLLARELGIPLNLEDACQLAVQGPHIRPIDAMQIDNRLFLAHISFGVYSKIAAKTTPEAKRYFRQIAYVWNAIPEILGKRSWRFALGVDGRIRRLRASFIMVANVGGVGAGDLRWGPAIEPDDGELDICAIHARSVWDYIVFGWNVLLHRHQETPRLTYYRAGKTVRIRTHRRVPVRGDGEPVHPSSVDIRVLPKAVDMIVPP